MVMHQGEGPIPGPPAGGARDPLLTPDLQDAIVSHLSSGAFNDEVAEAVGIGKGHPLTTPVLTPLGWMYVGDLDPGDEVIGADGRATVVEGVFDRGTLDVFTVRFNDGAEVTCDGDHLWRVQEKGRWSTLDTRTLASAGRLQTPEGANRYGIPLVQQVHHEPVDLPVAPYLLGVLLANGHLEGTPAVATNDPHVIAAVKASGETVKEHHGEGYSAHHLSIHDMRHRLRVLGLYGTRAASKFVPAVYLTADLTSRRALLAGLLDCDGSVRVSNGQAMFSSASSRLADDVVELARSLGGVARRRAYDYPDRPGVEHHVGVLVPDNPFTTPRKAQAWRRPSKMGRRIESISYAGREEVRCIKVAAPDSLYVVQNHVVTHNTTFYDWKNKGRLANEKAEAGGDLSPREVTYLDFFKAVSQARGRATVHAHATIRAAMTRHWQAAAWYLERTNPRRYARRTWSEEEVPTTEELEGAPTMEADTDTDVDAVVTYAERWLAERDRSAS